MAISNVVRRWLPAVLLTIFVCECVWFMRTQSLTFDEPIHIAEGLDALRNHRFQDWNDHPPLARLWCALPLFANSEYLINALPLLGPEGKISDFSPDPQAIAVRARSMILVFGLILGLLIWKTARRMFSSAAANLALALFVFSPALVAHSSLATTDCIAALIIFATAAVLLWWRKRPTLARTAAFGLVLGLLLLAKFSTPPMFVLALGWMLVLQPEWLRLNPLRWNWGKMVMALLIASFVVWAGYFFHVSHLQIQDGMLTATFPNRTPFEHKVNFQHLKLSMPLPAGEYFQGLWRVAQDNKMGHAAFFLGRISKRGGFKLYYPATVLLKWPVMVLLLFAVSCGLLLAHKIRVPAGLWVMLSFPAVYFAMAIFAHFNIGDRHILPVYPFVLLVACGVWEAAVMRGWARKLMVAAVLLAAIDSLRSGPDYLSFFNVYVRPSEAYRLLTDSNLDWGQGLLALRDYESAHPKDEISLAYFGSVDPRAYGIKARLLGPGEHARGMVIVSATNLSGQYLDDPQSYRWVLEYPQVGIVNGNMYVFKVP